MENTWETFQTAYQAASVDTKAVIDSEAIPLCVRSVVESNKLDDSHFVNLVKLYSLFVLEAIEEQTILEEVKKLGVPESKTVHEILRACLKNEPVVENSDVSKPSEFASDIEEAEATLKAIPQIRTMARDMSQTKAAGEKTYTSTQEAILKEAKPISEKTNSGWGNTNQ